MRAEAGTQESRSKKTREQKQEHREQMGKYKKQMKRYGETKKRKSIWEVSTVHI